VASSLKSVSSTYGAANRAWNSWRRAEIIASSARRSPVPNRFACAIVARAKTPSSVR